MAAGRGGEVRVERRSKVLYSVVTILFLLNWGRLIAASYYQWPGMSRDSHFPLACLLAIFPTPWLAMGFDRQLRLSVLGCCAYVALGLSVSLLFRH
jgi:hypothetical protein